MRELSGEVEKGKQMHLCRVASGMPCSTFSNEKAREWTESSGGCVATNLVEEHTFEKVGEEMTGYIFRERYLS